MSISGIPNPAIPSGSWVVITGVSGFIGSHVADQVLAAGFKVRGTTRDAQRSSWVQEHFKEKYGDDVFELIEIRDMEVEDAFDGVVKGAAGFIHVANDMTGTRDPKIAIPRAVASTINALAASAKEPAMRRFVYTSSSFAVTQPKPDKVFTLTTESFNEEAVKHAYQPGADGETVYAASKVEAERAISSWVHKHKPNLVVNTLQPNANIGPLINSSKQGYPTSAKWVQLLFNHDYESLGKFPPQHYINVVDDARLHVIALTHPEVHGERIFAIAGPVNHNDMIDILRQLYPRSKWETFPDDSRDLSIFEPIKRARELLREAYGVDFTDLRESVKGNAADLGE